MSILKQLEKEKQQRVKEQNNHIDFAKQLLSSNEVQEREVLRGLGLDDHLVKGEMQQELSILDKKYQEEYEGKIFHINEIYKIGMKYRLYLKTANLYRGVIPADIGSIILRMKEKHNLHLDRRSNNSDTGKFFILAPPDMFKDYSTFGEKVVKLFTDVNEARKEAIRKREADPCMFYQIDDKHFKLIKKWGSDFTLILRIKGWYCATATKLVLTFLLAIIFIVQLPFRMWPVADLWVPVKWGFFADKEIHILNEESYRASHVLVFIVSLAIAVTLIISIINSVFEGKHKIWGIDHFSTKSKFKNFIS